MLGIVAIIGLVFGLLLSVRIKANKEFKKLPEEQQQDFIKHNNALKWAKSRKHKSSDILGSSDVDF